MSILDGLWEAASQSWRTVTGKSGSDATRVETEARATRFLKSRFLSHFCANDIMSAGITHEVRELVVHGSGTPRGGAYEEAQILPVYPLFAMYTVMFERDGKSSSPRVTGFISSEESPYRHKRI